MKAKDLTPEQRDEFSTLFYQYPDAPKDNLSDNPCPWGCPWYFGGDVGLKGNTISEMVENYLHGSDDDEPYVEPSDCLQDYEAEIERLTI